MIQEHEQFIREQSKTRTGKEWREVFTAIVTALYDSRGKSLDKVALDQNTAAVIEKEILERMALGDQELKPQKGDEYR